VSFPRKLAALVFCLLIEQHNGFAQEAETEAIDSQLLSTAQGASAPAAAADKRLFDQQCNALFSAALNERSVEFRHSSSTLSTSNWALLDELVQIAADCPNAKILITGHTDSTGPEIANIALSKERADAVANHMSVRGILAGRITVAGVGSSQPLSSEDSRLARGQNRRIEIRIHFPGSF